VNRPRAADEFAINAPSWSHCAREREGAQLPSDVSGTTPAPPRPSRDLAALESDASSGRIRRSGSAAAVERVERSSVVSPRPARSNQPPRASQFPPMLE